MYAEYIPFLSPILQENPKRDADHIKNFLKKALKLFHANNSFKNTICLISILLDEEICL